MSFNPDRPPVTPPAGQPRKVQPEGQGNEQAAMPEQRFRAAITSLRNQVDWQTWTHIATLTNGKKYQTLYSEIRRAGILPDIEIDSSANTVVFGHEAREVLNRAANADKEVETLLKALSEKLPARERLTLLISVLYEDSPNRRQALEMLGKGAPKPGSPTAQTATSRAIQPTRATEPAKTMPRTVSLPSTPPVQQPKEPAIASVATPVSAEKKPFPVQQELKTSPELRERPAAAKESGPRSPEEKMVAQYAEQYANLDPEDIKLTPELWQSLRKYQQAGAFEFSCYMEHEWSQAVTSDQNNLRLRKPLQQSNPRDDLIPDIESHDDIIARNYVHGKLGVVEALTAMPLHHGVSVEVREKQPGGFFRKEVPAQVESHIEPIPYNQAIEGQASPEDTVRLTYRVSDPALYRTNLVTEDTVRELWKLRKDKDWTAAVNPATWQQRRDDVLNLQQLTKNYFETGAVPSTAMGTGRPGNTVTMSILAPKSEAEKLYKYFTDHPEQVRPFFVLGSAPLQIGHVPPPFEVWDKTSKPMLFRKYFDETKTKYDEQLKTHPTRKKNLS